MSLFIQRAYSTVGTFEGQGFEIKAGAFVLAIIIREYRQKLHWSRRAPGYFTWMMARLHLLHANILWLHSNNVLILTPERWAKLMYELAMDVARSVPQGLSTLTWSK